MLRKRLIGTVVIRNGWAVQSFEYNRWLPLGKPECLVQNLDRWGSDEIVILCINRKNNGPDLELIERLSGLSLTTPLTYGGGIRTPEEAKQAIKAGAERLILDSILTINPHVVEKIGAEVGIQALIAALPLINSRDNRGVLHLNHNKKTTAPVSQEIKSIISEEKVSELLLIDARGEGSRRGFNTDLFGEIESYCNLPLLLFGGLSNARQIKTLLSKSQVAGVVIGNELNYKEESIARLKSALLDQPLRKHRDCF